MFGLSPNKILFTALIIAAVWYGFKWLNRLQDDQKKKTKHATRNDRTSAGETRSKDADFEELVACPTCGDYVIADKKSGCGKENCPYDKLS